MSRAKVMVVEDDIDVREFLRDALKILHEVTEARNGVAAFKYFDDGYRPDAIVTDLVMPRMDGMTMVDRIRETDWGTQTPIIILTGVTANDDIPAHVWKEGTKADLFMEKPIEIEELFDAIDRLIKKRKNFTPLEPGTGSYDDE